jgi:hypothetical protein
MSQSPLPQTPKAIYKQLEILADRRREIMREETRLKKQLISLSKPLPVHKGKILFKNSRATLIELIEKKFAKRKFFTVKDVFKEMTKRYPVAKSSKEYKLLHSNVSRTMTGVLRDGLVEVVDDVKPRRYKVAAVN